jgi:hypothetical protein
MTDPAETATTIDKLNKVQIGRIVHFKPTTLADCMASLVTAVHDKAGVNGNCNLAVFTASGAPTSQTSVPRDLAGFGWHWPNECPRKDA